MTTTAILMKTKMNIFTLAGFVNVDFVTTFVKHAVT